MYLETALRKLIEDMELVMQDAFPSTSIDPLKEECISLVERLLDNTPQRSYQFDLSCSTKSIEQIASTYGENISVGNQKKIELHLREVNLLLFMFASALAESKCFTEWQERASGLLAAYVGFYAEHAKIHSITEAFQNLMNEAVATVIVTTEPDQNSSKPPLIN